MPALNNVSDAALNTQMRLTRFEVGFARVPLISPQGVLGHVHAGPGVRATLGTLPTLQGTTLTRFGAVLNVTGRAKASDLRLPA